MGRRWSWRRPEDGDHQIAGERIKQQLDPVEFIGWELDSGHSEELIFRQGSGFDVQDFFQT